MIHPFRRRTALALTILFGTTAIYTGVFSYLDEPLGDSDIYLGFAIVLVFQTITMGFVYMLMVALSPLRSKTGEGRSGEISAPREALGRRG